ncbi:MarR family winged helix-turn-helix transcriptional regulator [Enterococcus sp. AZ072]|uniref:MarR family winged helix-turn-helix transcriptional regulator n=1 Tax=unclassified Enterococcus TaxID=2608891 RepID=UPI003D28F57F
MSQFTDNLMKQMRFISSASNAFMGQRKQHLTGQLRVLAILEKEDGLIQSQLAEILDLRPSSLAELLKKMEKSGDVVRKEEEQDRRLKRVFLTDQGREKISSLAGSGKDQSEDFFAGLTEEEKQQFSEYLQKIAAGWDKKFQEQAERFVDPMDRLRQMQDFREQFGDFDGDWRNLSRDDRRKFRDEMRKEMRNNPFCGGRRGGFPNGFPRGGKPEFPQDFWGGGFGGGPRGPKPFDEDHRTDENDEWKDF